MTLLPRRLPRSPRFLLLPILACTSLLSACSDPSSNASLNTVGPPATHDDGGAPDDDDDGGGVPGEDALRFEQRVVVKTWALPNDGGSFVLLERPLVMREEWGSPAREVRWLDGSGKTVRSHTSPDARELVDATVHPSGQVTLLLAADAGYTLLRLDVDGRTLAETRIDDPNVGSDLPKLPEGAPTGPVERTTHDAARIAAIGEDVILGGRTERHSVVAYRANFVAAREEHAFAIGWRTLVEPALSIMPVGLIGGTYDTFGQLEAQYAVNVAVDEAGHVYVAVNSPHILGLKFVQIHEAVFGDKLAIDPDGVDVFVTRLTDDGTRLGTSVVGTAEEDQMFGLRAGVDRAWVVGRKEHWNEEGTGWDALVGSVEGTNGAVSVREFDIDKSDIAFDLATVPGDGVVVVGASGYWQNPHGASVSEECHTFARWLKADGSIANVKVPNGPRHSEVRSVRILEGDKLSISGMLDGPGTHTADADLTLLRATGFFAERSLR